MSHLTNVQSRRSPRRAFASRDSYHLDRWRVALIAGLAQKRCAGIARSTGLRCRGTPLKFSTKCRCHCLGSERIAVDAKRLSWLERQLPRTGNAKVRANIEARIARIERRRLRWVWRTDPTVEGATISLSPRDLPRVRDWLRYVARVDNFDALTAVTAFSGPARCASRDGRPKKRRSRVCEPLSRMKLDG